MSESVRHPLPAKLGSKCRAMPPGRGVRTDGVGMEPSGGRSKRKAAEDDASASIHESLTCPVCMDMIPPPVYQCPEGHLFCNDCLSKLEASKDAACPSCRTKFPTKRIRSLLGDHLAKSLLYPCPYQAHGCNAEMKHDEREAHAAICPCKPVKCPQKDCTWTGKPRELVTHLRQHSPAVRVLESGQFTELKDRMSMDSGLYFDKDGFRDSYVRVAWSWMDSTFVLRRDPLMNGQLLRFTLRVASAATQTAPAPSFDFELRLSEQEQGQSVEYKGPVMALSSDSTNIGCTYVCLADALRFRKSVAATPNRSPPGYELWAKVCVKKRAPAPS